MAACAAVGGMTTSKGGQSGGGVVEGVLPGVRANWPELFPSSFR